MLPLIQAEALKNNWLTMEQIVDFIAVSESTPGPFALNMATFVGTETGGASGIFLGNVLGALCATLGVVLPSFIVIIIVARMYLKFKENKIVSGCMNGLKPVVIGLISSAVISVGKTVFFPNITEFSLFGRDFLKILNEVTSFPFLVSAVLFAVMLYLAIKKKINPIYIIVISAGVGIATGYIGELM